MRPAWRSRAAIYGLIGVLGFTALACGGSGSDTEEPPLISKSVPLRAINGDTQNTHIVYQTEAFADANRVNPGQTIDRIPPVTFEWMNSGSVVRIQVIAGRNGVQLDTDYVDFSVPDALANRLVYAEWNGTDLTAQKIDR